MTRFLFFALFFLLPSIAIAQTPTTIKIGTPTYRDEPTDVFIETFIGSNFLAAENIKAELIEMQDLSPSKDYVKLLRERVYDFAFLSTPDITRTIEEDLPHAELLEVPLLFSSLDDQVRLQNSLYGQVVIAEVGRTGIFPLAFWRRLPNQLISTMPIASLEQFRGMHVRASDQVASDVMQHLVDRL